MATVKSLLSLILNVKPSATTHACFHSLSPKLLENWQVGIPALPYHCYQPLQLQDSVLALNQYLTHSGPIENGISHILSSKKGGAPTGPLKIPRAKELPRKRNPSCPRERETVSA